MKTVFIFFLTRAMLMQLLFKYWHGKKKKTNIQFVNL